MSTRYHVVLDRAASKSLRKLDRPVQARIIAKLAALEVEPRPVGVKALTGHPGLLRVRVGDYRIVYTIRDHELIVLVLHLGHRGDIYDQL